MFNIKPYSPNNAKTFVQCGELCTLTRKLLDSSSANSCQTTSC